MGEKDINKRPGLEECVGNVVIVRWIDSCEPQDNADILLHELPKPQDIEQYGVLLRVEPDHIVVAGAMKGNPGHKELETSYDYVIAIPTVAVLHWQPLTRD